MATRINMEVNVPRGGMSKKELVEVLTDVPDDARVQLYVAPESMPYGDDTQQIRLYWMIGEK